MRSSSPNILTVPNFLSGLRFVLLPVFAIFILKERYKASLLIFLISSISDFFDGFLARRLKSKTQFGAYLDFLADHSTIFLVFLLLCFSPELSFRIPIWLFVLVAARDVSVGGLGVAIRRVLASEPVVPFITGKIAIFCQYTTACIVVLANILTQVFREYLSGVMVAVYAVTGAFTLISGIQYMKKGIGLWIERRGR